MILPVLKARTQAQHDRVEALIPLMADPLPPGQYAWTLARLYGLYVPLDAALLRVRLPDSFEYGARRKLDALHADLTALGVPPGTLPLAPAPAWSSTAHALGALYVLEGATLGGQLISRHLGRQLGLSAARGAAFFASYGPDLGRMWRAFGAALEAHVAAHGGHEDVVRGAEQTFGAFEAWLSAPPRALERPA
ncbi:biliverdin-producing heme oxygenase [Deinococcus maricopensis]|uniref:Heme oxygenase n=1 Tax=Deinococcus maricopensis (strain DSM 21211 / LMG 22137 / NRRL B-23946 / LB-34) TaxID=709986 RepID=E8U3T2_DEIML|nr:biliverdin-producing heme oxygenase [Deinococcus maricopensis]ADV68775.1 heme oxygenase [Deinococcus maricopensis DSM 21211]